MLARYAVLLSVLCLGTKPVVAQNEIDPASERKMDDYLLRANAKLKVLRECSRTSNTNEIVVCANDENTKYRVPLPNTIRDIKTRDRSWGSRYKAMEASGDAMRINSNSAVGSGGQTGQSKQAAEAWCEERKEINQARYAQQRDARDASGNVRSTSLAKPDGRCRSGF